MALSGVFGNVFGDGDHAPTSQVVDGVSYNNGNLVGTYDTGGGGIIPSENDVRLGVSVGATTGNLRVPAVGDVRLGTVYDSSDTLTGTLDVDDEANYPTEPQVQSGITYGSSSQFTGSLDVDTAANLPEVAEVLLGVTYGSSSQLAGTYRGAVIADVRLGVAYGASDSLSGLLDLPAITDVRLGVQYDQTAKTGDVRVPPVEKVEIGYAYDTADSLTGTLDPGAGGTIPSADDVRLGTAVGQGTGTLRVPVVGDVRSGTAYDANDSLAGLLDLPSITDVRLGVQYDQTTKTGDVRLPTEGDVRAGTAYDTSDSRTGTLDVTGDPPVYPPESDVRLGVSYGTDTNPTQFTGNVRVPPAAKVETGYAYDTLDSVIGALETGTIPDITDVRFGVSVGDGLTGVLQLPVEAQVLIGVGYGAYGTEYEGTLTDLPGGSGQVLPPVLGSGQLRSPLCIGDSYLVANGNAFQWLIDPIVGMTTAAEVRFYGRKSCDNDCTGDIAWDVTANPVDQGEFWLLSLDMTSAESGAIPVGEYKWYLTLSEADTLVTIECGLVGWVCK